MLLSLGYAAAVIATRQGLRVIDGPPPCHGYRNGCVCGSCVERVRVGRRAKREQPRQPWQPTPAKRAA